MYISHIGFTDFFRYIGYFFCVFIDSCRHLKEKRYTEWSIPTFQRTEVVANKLIDSLFRHCSSDFVIPEIPWVI